MYEMIVHTYVHVSWNTNSATVWHHGKIHRGNINSMIKSMMSSNKADSILMQIDLDLVESCKASSSSVLQRYGFAVEFHFNVLYGSWSPQSVSRCEIKP